MERAVQCIQYNTTHMGWRGGLVYLGGGGGVNVAPHCGGRKSGQVSLSLVGDAPSMRPILVQPHRNVLDSIQTNKTEPEADVPAPATKEFETSVQAPPLRTRYLLSLNASQNCYSILRKAK